MHIYVYGEDDTGMTKEKMELYKLKAELCKTFADPKRLMLIDILRHGEATVTELVEELGMQQAVVSRNLAVLRHRGIVKTRRQGIRIYYSLADAKIGEACDVVHKVLLNQMESHKHLAERLTAKEK